MSERAEQLVSSLTTYSPAEALALIKTVETKRYKEEYIRFWQPQTQQEPHFKAFTPKIKTFVITGGNRSGKTDEGAAITAAWFLGKDYFKDDPAWSWIKDLPIKEPPNNIWVVGLDFGMLKNVIWREKFLEGRTHPALIPLNSLRKPPNEADMQLFGKNGSTITCKSAESGREKFQSAAVDFIWIDEEPPVEIYDECYQRTADTAGKILVTLTPLVDIASGVRTPWVYDLKESMKDGQKDIAFVSLSVLDNPHIPADEKEKLKEKWAGHDEERARLYGEFVRRTGLVYRMWDRKKHLIKPIPLPKDWPCWVSIDPASAGPTAAVWAKIHPQTNDIYITKVYKEKDLAPSEHSKNIKLINAGDSVDIWIIDPKGGNQRLAQASGGHKTLAQMYKEAGLPVRLAKVDETYGQEISREYLNATVTEGSRLPKLYVFADCYEFIDEIEHYVWAVFGKGESKGLSKEKPVKRNDHLMNAWQYLAAMRPKGNYRTAYVPNPENVREMVKYNSYTS